MSQLGKLPRSMTARPREPNGRPLHNFKPAPGALQKLLAEHDATFADIDRRLSRLEKDADISLPEGARP